MSPSAVALLVAAIAAIGIVTSAWITSRGSSKVTAQSSATATLDKAYEQRIIFRDEQISDLTGELVEIRNQLTAAAAQIEKLTGEVQRLTKLVVTLGGVPHAE